MTAIHVDEARDKELARDARPEHFHRAVEHGFSLVLSGAPIALLGTMARGCTARGLTDAAAGYDHVRLRLTVALQQEGPYR